MEAGSVITHMSGLLWQAASGESAIVLHQNGTIEIKGKNIQIDASDGVKINGKQVDINS